MLEYVKGDVLNSGEKYIVHGCNCKNNMGSGVARQVREQYPDAWKADQATLWGDVTKLGGYTSTKIGDVTIYNAYTQYNYGRMEGIVYVEYHAIRSSLSQICEDFPEMTVLAMPKIGAGLAQGDWNVIELILKEVSDKYNKTFRVYIYE